MKNIWHIVITGGPCAGKTTAFGTIEQELTEKGYKVFVVPESFTDMFNGGIKLSEYDTVTFQAMLMRFQLAKEVTFLEAAENIDNENVVVLYDRGLIDNKAYMSEEQFKAVLDDTKQNETELKERYDAVIHLVTAANGAEKYYSLDNKARYETIDQARAVDKALIDAWTGHPHLRVVDNSTDFNGKISRVMKEIYSILGVPAPLEIERKYLIKKPDMDEIMKLVKCSKSDIIQTYLCDDGSGFERRIRQRGTDGRFTYYYTTKQRVSDLVRIEKERKITEREYLALLMETDANLKVIKKTRYCFMWNNTYYEIDIYPMWKDVAIVEVEVSDENQEISFPDFIEVKREVTNELPYKNYYLAQAMDN